MTIIFQIEWYEALSLFLVYLCYASFMKFNVEIENAVKSKLFGQISLPEEVQIEQQSPIMPSTRVRYYLWFITKICKFPGKIYIF